MCNPFSPELDPDKLIALHTGVAVKGDVANKILNLHETGKKWMDNFIEECKVDPKRFEARIPRQKVNKMNSFSNDYNDIKCQTFA